MVRFAELRERVADAERAWSSGDWPGAFDRYSALSTDIRARCDGRTLDVNESLILGRFADIAAERGQAALALRIYGELQRHAGRVEDRALAGFKRLDVAVGSGDGVLAREVRREISDKIWREPLPTKLEPTLLEQWERTLAWPRTEASALFAQMYLALGRWANAARRLEEATILYTRGIECACSTDDPTGRLTEIPLRLALALNQLTLGNLTACASTLKASAELIARRAGGSVYQLWQWLAEARLALVAGRLADALALLQQAEGMSRARQHQRTTSVCLLARAELLILLNLLPEADACLAEVEPPGGDTDRELHVALIRVRFLRSARAGALAMVPAGESAGEMMTGTRRSRRAAVSDLQTVLDDAAVVWSGDCLQDYELRETAIYAQLESAPQDANRDLQDLWRDFSSAGSRLIDARLHAIAGLVLSRVNQLEAAAESLQRAYDLHVGIGAEREAYQVTLFLSRAYQQTNRAAAEALLADNDRRLQRLTVGLKVEQRNAFLASKYTSTEEQQRAVIERLLSMRAQARERKGLRKLRPQLRYWRALHAVIGSLDREQERRQKDTPGGSPTLGAGWRGLAYRLVCTGWRQLTVGYLALPDQLFMFETRWGWMDCRVLDVGRVAAASLHRALVEDPGKFDTTAAHICQILGVQDALDRSITRIQSLRVIADAALHLVPFCALRYRGADNQLAYLLERVSVVVDTTTRPRGRRRLSGRAVVAHYAGTDRHLACAAPAAEHAATVIERRWKVKCETVTDRRSCIAALPGAAVLYYFGHGHFEAGDPDRSGMEFSGPHGNELLSLRDIDGVDLAQVRQAVVFACHSSDMVPYSGRWAVGLPHMLLRRGASSVLGSIWETTPEVAAQVSRIFLERAPIVGRAGALREAQLQLLRSVRAADPFWWAAFQLYGDGGRP